MRAFRSCWAAFTDLFTGVPAEAGPLAAPRAGAAGEGDERFGSRLHAQLVRQPGRLAAACVASLLGPAVVAQVGSIGTERAAQVHASSDSSTGPVPVPIPGDHGSWLPVARRAAATCPGLSSAVLVAISTVESSLGLDTGPSSAGAVGPMQFLPSTWAAYGVDGDGDGLTDVMNPIDAVHGAARLLCANGGADPAQLPAAVWNYNHSDDYVRRVISLARVIPV